MQTIICPVCGEEIQVNNNTEHCPECEVSWLDVISDYEENAIEVNQADWSEGRK